MWLSSWDDAWLLLAVEGKLEHDYVKDAFGANEAKAALHTRRRALLAAAPVALVPNAARKGRAELDEWGGCVHPEQLLSSPNRALKAAFVLHSLEAQCTSSGGERGTVAFAKAMGSLLVLPPAHLERRIVGGHGLIAACASGCAASADLDGFESMWVRQALPCPTLKANFQYVRRKYVVELVLVLPPRDASALTGPLRVSWGEAANSEDGAYVQEEVLTLTNEHMQMHELTVDARRRRGGKRRKSGGGDMKEEAMVEEAYNETAAVPLLWLRVDPSLEWACRVAWSGRPREPL